MANRQTPGRKGDEGKPRPLGEFLRAVREGLVPAEFGLAGGTRRRTPGLRREEVAVLCGISPTWLTWIEQGRTTAISVGALADIARGLHLSQAERAYLFQLAGRADPILPGATDFDLRQFHDLARAVRSPAYVLGSHWDALAWNQPAAELFQDWLGKQGRVSNRKGARSGTDPDPNLLRYVFLHPAAPAFIVDWEERAYRLVAEYRADSASWRNDPLHQKLIEDLCFASPVFDAAWRSQRVLAREGGLRGFLHPRRGRCDYRQFTMRLAQQSEVKVVVLHPYGSTPSL